MVACSVVLTDAQENLAQALAASRRYQHASEMMRAGLRLLEQEEARLSEIRAGLLEGLAQAKASVLAQGSGENAIPRAFANARSSS